MKQIDDKILDRIKKVTDPYCQVTREQLQNMSSYFQVKSYPARHTLKASGKEEKVIRFLVEGQVGLFHKDDKKVYCGNIFMADQIASDMISYILKQPTTAYLVTYTPCKVVEFNRDMRNVIREEVPEFSELSTAFFKIEVVNLSFRIQFLRKPTKEITDWVEEQKGSLYQVAPVKDVAQCFNISPEHFSRVRNDKGHKGKEDDPK
ncbi:Crp/Fnr family transcriptional regulator [Litoribacter populi]|uniref:Crp/Fnr family transcriptional regulator n=1 Tax=Litoribacter populi TaxID=2598460 RepID=UPI0011816183|nr:Crp/Fnr family transcriptional regulator [Litoribacter populi]